MKQICLRGKLKPRRIRQSSRDGCWYVSDEMSDCVKVYSANWRLVRRIGESTFQCPAGLAIDSKVQSRPLVEGELAWLGSHVAVKDHRLL